MAPGRPGDPRACAAPDGEPAADRLARVQSTPVQLTLELDASIYQPAALERSARAFAGLARIVIRTGGGSQLIYFSGVEADVRARLVDEFANYALGCMVVEP